MPWPITVRRTSSTATLSARRPPARSAWVSQAAETSSAAHGMGSATVALARAGIVMPADDRGRPPRCNWIVRLGLGGARRLDAPLLAALIEEAVGEAAGSAAEDRHHPEHPEL